MNYIIIVIDWRNKLDNIILETKSLILRKWNINDINDLQEGLNDIEVTKWKGYDNYPYTIQDAKNEIETILKKYENENYYNQAIVLKSENKVIGRIGLYDIYDDVAHGGGIWINRKYWNRGYATEAMKARTEFAFEKLNLRKIENSFFEGNEASWKLQEKLGYKIEGVKRQAIRCKADGIIKNECITGLLKNEWKK